MILHLQAKAIAESKPKFSLSTEQSQNEAISKLSKLSLPRQISIEVSPAMYRQLDKDNISCERRCCAAARITLSRASLPDRRTRDQRLGFPPIMCGTKKNMDISDADPYNYAHYISGVNTPDWQVLLR